MTYVISDIHGCYDDFMRLLSIINFSDKDTLYVLGDCCDRGPENMAVLFFMMQHDNIIPLLGNHELMGLPVYEETVYLTKKEFEESTRKGVIEKNKVDLWFYNGGDVTLNEFLQLEEKSRIKIFKYIKSFKLYERITVNEKDFLLIHSLPEADDSYLHLDDGTYEPLNLLFGRPDFGSPDSYTYPDIEIVIGHTPTAYIYDAIPGRILKCGSLTDIDCGCVGGYCLGAYCLETGESFYTR